MTFRDSPNDISVTGLANEIPALATSTSTGRQ